MSHGSNDRGKGCIDIEEGGDFDFAELGGKHFFLFEADFGNT